MIFTLFLDPTQYKFDGVLKLNVSAVTFFLVYAKNDPTAC